MSETGKIFCDKSEKCSIFLKKILAFFVFIVYNVNSIGSFPRFLYQTRQAAFFATHFTLQEDTI